MSTSSCIGLLGDSKKTADVCCDNASRHWSRSVPSTNTLSTPQLGRISSRTTKQEPKRLRELTTRSPLPSNAPSATKTAVSYTHLRAHETVLDLVCRLLLEK